MAARDLAIALLLMVAAPALAAQKGKLVTETEPNDDPAHANVIQLGDTISGTKTYQNTDYFAFDLPAGTKIILTVPEHGFCAGIALSGPDGFISGHSCVSYRGPRDTVFATTTRAGRYYASIEHPPDMETPGDAGRIIPYKLRLGRFEAPELGLGNPLTKRARGFERIMAMVPAPNGDLLVATSGYQQDLIKRMTSAGLVTTFAAGFKLSGEQIAVDALGDLLVPSGDLGGVVWRYNLASGARTIFTAPPSSGQPYTGVAIGADGDVWLVEWVLPRSSSTLHRFDALGTPKSVLTIPMFVFGMVTAQSGELFFQSNSGSIYRLVNNASPQLVITGSYGRFALDRDGWVYVNQPPQGKLLLFNAQYQLARDPLAQIVDSLPFVEAHVAGAPAWSRDTDGKMTSRLLVGRGPGFYDEWLPTDNEILEVNRRGMGSPGADPLLHPKHKTMRNASVRTAYADTLHLDEAGSATWSFVSGQLPDGVSLSSAGVLSGTPTRNATYDFLVKAVNGARAGFGRFSIAVSNSPPVQVTVEAISDALMGGAALPAATVQYLDNLGNKNGRLDVGDFRAYLRSQGQLSGAPIP